ncbi:IBR finger domain-containing protein [Colletotrichum fioriniae PJ7]|uniref:RBR-type E3 ubiquitin transferase n=1 Tax=Colletotrichum fioriniae PJ7 TaxID=1445577 RepID=A0A010R9F7_9PEZI|nr:IBR finger domain-containing protein [Colletotrichum fioriniae PJ7]
MHPENQIHMSKSEEQSARSELEPIELHDLSEGICLLVLLVAFIWYKLMSIPEITSQPPMLCYEIDDESLRLVLQMQLEDLENIKESSKGKCRVDEVSDLDLAVDAYHAELESQAVLAADRCMCKSIAKANQSDGRLIAILTKQENQATRDREAAIRLSNGATLGEDAYTPIAVAQLPCKHNYCRDCLRTLFELSLTDESLFPPRCCKLPIPVDGGFARVLLSPKLVGEFRAKEIEFSTPNRTYCHRPTCSIFIPKEFIRGDVGTCPQCQYQTCTMCKGAEHGNQDCAQDTSTQALLEVAAANGWQRCSSCRRIVELDHGCYHMTCPCGSQFCYLCGLQWKTCTCEQWNEERLVARANVIVNREADAMHLNAAVRAQRVEQEALNLVQNHQCAHNRWRSRSGSFRVGSTRVAGADTIDSEGRHRKKRELRTGIQVVGFQMSPENSKETLLLGLI